MNPASPNTVTATGAPKSKEEKLLALMAKTGYDIVQENGQRKYGPPPNWKGAYPPKGCEVFVGKLPRDLYEDELVPAFEEVGPIFEVRLMMDFSGTNRGFAFVMYTSLEDAKKAIKVMNNYEIRKGKIIGVCKSVDNCRLFVGGIPKNKARHEIKAEMDKVTECVVDVILYSSVQDKTKNRGFAFVEYENHRAAAMARRKLIPGKIQLWGHEIAVDWAEPEPEVDEETMAKVTVLYVRNLMPETSEELIRDTFSLEGSLKVDKVKKLRDFAFVHYPIRQDAEQALRQLDQSTLDGSIVEVTWAKPADRVNRRGGNRNNMVQMVASYPAGPVVYGSTGYDLIYGPPSYGYPQPTLQSAGGASSGYMVPRVAIRGRSSRGAAGIKGMRGNLSYNSRSSAGMRRPTEFHFIDLQPSMELIPTNSYPLKPIPSPAQVLQDVCQKNNWGEPIFTLHSTVHPEMGENVQLFLYKVSIPGITSQFSQYQPPKVCQYMEEAKQYAAQYVLSQLGVPFESMEQSQVVNGQMPPGSGATQMGPSGGPYNRVSFIGAPTAFEPGFYEQLPHLPIY